MKKFFALCLVASALPVTAQAQSVTVSSLTSAQAKTLIEAGKDVCAVPAASGARLCISKKSGLRFDKPATSAKPAAVAPNDDHVLVAAEAAKKGAFLASLAMLERKRVLR